ncbi:hypothetical protein NAP1_09712 [Erythrobacter sp. NAP1]|nr:hypothetical protein NAP1_09712 [Erythrobacter sp. NAP1]
MFASVSNLLASPEEVIRAATLQKFAKITPQYPGVRSELPRAVSLAWLKELSPLLDKAFGASDNGWEMQAWFSLVTAKPSELVPMQRFPHVDGTNPRQLAMMLYLHDTPHGGTGFFRQRSTGLEALTDENFPRYRQALENDVRTNGLPPAAYVTDGAPYFERTHTCEGAFNQAFFYRGNVLHSGLIDGSQELSPDPAKGRLTINAFFRPIE